MGLERPAALARADRRARAFTLRLVNCRKGVDKRFEITLEPASGSATGRPTAPIVDEALIARPLKTLGARLVRRKRRALQRPCRAIRLTSIVRARKPASQ